MIFFCNDNELTSLEGAPKKVGGVFNCQGNNLITLKGAPKIIHGFFSCENNKIKFTKEDVKQISQVEGSIYV